MMVHCEIINFKCSRVVIYKDLFDYDTPYFVMTPGSTREFSLRLIPKNELLQGFAIKIIGIRWQLFDVMQGFHCFRILNQNRNNPFRLNICYRMNR
eukprot:UN03137